ncbi:helix-turn-helix domain-containing protein [Chondrinema litorale]|uniref:helix-turn-helix domain-containing protein n=1 Tax=Chondrinema litorale TaxID=2994555 RepID=UPI00254349D0|nr:AraC family transcriptional regulator [Chondrinema litorale]UZR98119.1 AraC family transcriptional regulator [Chondrinema litorale]
MIQKSETINEFYKRVSLRDVGVETEPQANKEWGHFNVYKRNEIACKNYTPYNRRDFYKISLVIGKGMLYYADKWLKIDRNILLFSNPNVPYSWEATSTEQSGYFCLFTEDFVTSNHQSDSILQYPLFKVGGNPVYFIDDEQTQKVSKIYEDMMAEMETGYRYKYDLIRSYMNLIIHEALKMEPADSYLKHKNAASRITSMFLELLERQFPVSLEYTLQLKSANDFADRLSVHTNHLNRAVKKITGRTTTEHITSKIIQEAKAILNHTDWNIADVAYCLGFDDPSYFNNFFKKQTSITPKTFRN